MVRIPQIKSIPVALEVYYTNNDLGNKELRQLFGSVSANTLLKLKRLVVEKMEEKGVMRYNNYTINTEVAYETFGLDIAGMERKYAKMKKYGFGEQESENK